MKWFLRACPVCGGDLHEDIEDRGYASCFMCGRAFAVSELHGNRGRESAAEPVEIAAPAELPKAA